MSGGQRAAPSHSFSSLWLVSVQDLWLSTGCGGSSVAMQCVLLPRCILVPRLEKKLGRGPKTERSHPALFPVLGRILSGWQQEEAQCGGYFASRLDSGGWPWGGLG